MDKYDGHSSELLDLSRQYLCTYGEDLRFIETEPGFNKMLGYDPGELNGQPIKIMIAPEDWTRVIEHIHLRFSGKEPYSHYLFKARRKDDSLIQISTVSTVISIDSGRISVAACEDLTTRIKESNSLHEKHLELRAMVLSAIQALSLMSSIRDPYTGGHENRVGMLAAAIGRKLGLGVDRCESLQICGSVHDIGKVAVPVEILAKPGKLSPPEFEIVKTHTSLGYRILNGIHLPFPAATVAHQHHERLDGSGYPLGISGEQIILESRIIMVADVVEAMTSHRPYRPGLGLEVALAEIAKNAGKYFDIKITDACIALFRENEFTFPDGN